MECLDCYIKKRRVRPTPSTALLCLDLILLSFLLGRLILGFFGHAGPVVDRGSREQVENDVNRNDTRILPPPVGVKSKLSQECVRLGDRTELALAAS